MISPPNVAASTADAVSPIPRKLVERNTAFHNRFAVPDGRWALLLPLCEQGTQAGVFTTRTSDSEGVITFTEPHQFAAGDTGVAISWSGGARTGVTVDAATETTITVSGGTGSNLPVQDTAVVAGTFQLRNLGVHDPGYGIPDLTGPRAIADTITDNVVASVSLAFPSPELASFSSIDLYANSTGSTVNIPRGTYVSVVQITSLDAASPITSSGSKATTDGHMNIGVDTSGNISLAIRVSGVTESVSLAAGIAAGDVLLVIGSCGEHGMSLRCHNLTTGAYHEGSNATTSGFAVHDGQVWRANATTTTSTAATTNPFLIAFAPRQLADDEIDGLLADPWLAIRPPFDADALLSHHVLVTERPASGSITARLVTGHDPAEFDGITVRLRFGAGPRAMDKAITLADVDGADVLEQGDADALPDTLPYTKAFAMQALRATVTGVDGDTARYLTYDVLLDGEWHANPTGYSIASFGGGRAVIASDRHLSQVAGAYNVATDGFAQEEFLRGGSAQLRLIANYETDRAMMLAMRAAPESVYIDGGDNSNRDGVFESDSTDDYTVAIGENDGRATDAIFRVLRCGAWAAEVPSNHAGIGWWNFRGDNGDNGAYQKQSFIAHLTYAPLPPAGQFPLPTTDGQLASSIFCPAVDSEDAGDAVTFDIEFLRDHFRFPDYFAGVNIPLVWPVDVGPVRHVVFNTVSHTEAAPGESSDTRLAGQGVGARLRNTADDWPLRDREIERGLTLSRNRGGSLPHCVWHCHQAGGGSAETGTVSNVSNGYYGRAGWLHMTNERMIEAYDAGVIAMFWYHDHIRLHAVWSDGGDREIHVFVCPTAGAPSHSNTGGANDGWHFSQLRAIYGTAETGHLGAPNILDPDDQPLDLGENWTVLRNHNIPGFMVLDADSETLTLRAFVSHVPMLLAMGAPTPSFDVVVSRWAGNELPVASSAAETPTIPARVMYAADAADWDWESPPASETITQVGADAQLFAQPYTSASIALPSTSADAVVVPYVGMPLYFGPAADPTFALQFEPGEIVPVDSVASGAVPMYMTLGLI